MILKDGHSTSYLFDYRDGKIQQGLGLGIYLDDYLRFKRGQLNFILGHDNVGKSYWMLWYFLALATNHNLTFTLFMDENSAQKAMRDLIRMYFGRKITELTDSELQVGIMKIEHHFKFVDNLKRYTPEELLEVFKTSKTDAYLIDPFNGLKTALSYSSNYDVLNDLKMFCKTTNSTIYINAHPSTASGRRQAIYPQGHAWQGHITPPFKDDIEGGKAFSNKADDFIVIHRLIGSETMKFETLVEIKKVKDTDDGGGQTLLEQPIMFNYNSANGFKCGGIDCIKHPKTSYQAPVELPIPKYPPVASFYEAGVRENEPERIINDPDRGIKFPF